MISKINLSIRSAHRDDRRQIANLIHEPRVHRHLDWRPPLDWIGHEPFLVGENDRDLVAVLACPPDPPDIAWIRLLAVSADADPQEAWSSMWAIAREKLTHLDGVVAAAIPLHDWFLNLLVGSGFTQASTVIMLEWNPSDLPPGRSTSPVSLRTMSFDDIQTVEHLDNLAFNRLWCNSSTSLELALRQAAVAVVAEIEGQIVGYQISTANHMGGHLARLAIHPDFQGEGIGYSLVRDLLKQFEMRGAKRVTVNTQKDNIASLALYKKANFHTTGEKFPVYQYPLHG
jgi:ribosomal protein S18 acetylase RimI-like enzyme